MRRSARPHRRERHVQAVRANHGRLAEGTRSRVREKPNYRAPKAEPESGCGGSTRLEGGPASGATTGGTFAAGGFCLALARRLAKRLAAAASATR
jgi:hypothetical protein